MSRNVAVSIFVVAAWAAPLIAQSVTTAPPVYDVTAEITISGTVTQVLSAPGPDGSVGVHMKVQSPGQKPLMIHVAPALFIGMNNFSFLLDDQVTVTGSYVMHAGEIALWARTVSKGEHTLTLRDGDGTPRWPRATAEDLDGCGVAHEPLR